MLQKEKSRLQWFENYTWKYSELSEKREFSYRNTHHLRAHAQMCELLCISNEIRIYRFVFVEIVITRHAKNSL